VVLKTHYKKPHVMGLFFDCFFVGKVMDHSQSLDKKYFKGAVFDGVFVVGIAALAISVSLFADSKPEYFGLILTLNLWLLGYHHVIATYTRIAFDSESVRQNKFLLFQLPLIVICLVVFIYQVFGKWGLATIYLHWQWYHYTRQSEGVLKALKGRLTYKGVSFPKFDRCCFYFIPLAFFLIMSSSIPGEFLYFPVRTLVLPEAIVDFLKISSGCLCFVLLIHKACAVFKKQLPILIFAYESSHYLIYYVAYVYVENINMGWLAINIWHNLQYIMFVWVFNVNKHSRSLEASQVKSFIWYISQPHRALIYVLVCVLITIIIYYLFGHLVSLITPIVGFQAGVVVYQAVNFHHYIVDSVIWKLRRPSVRSNLGIL
jgi:hypothetical protein